MTQIEPRVYGYCRISRKEQNIDRQVRNILAEYPDATIKREAFTGTKVEGREVFNRLIAAVKPGDIIVFDSVSRMSRNAAQGIELYDRLHQQGVHLVFLKEHHIDTATYDKALADAVPMTGTNVDIILAAINDYLKVLRHEQIQLAFDQSQKEVDDLHQRTREGIETARRAGKQVGGSHLKGQTVTTKKSIAAKEQIRKYNKTFGGPLSDAETIKIAGISRNSFYKYKREMLVELESRAE
jgi:DNA invertase Pin-like site-specific DNA recombinase